jgi:DNA polymerase-3 subunit delta'
MFFREIINQETLKLKLLRSVHEERIAHAQLFIGENGTGGLPLALAYARYVNCTAKKEDDSCGECASCKMFTAFTHPDIHFTYPFISTKASGSTTESTEYLEEWRAALRSNPYLTYHDWMDKLEAENKQGNITAHECRKIIHRLALKPMYEGFKILIIWMPEYFGKEGNILLKLLEEPPENTLFLLVAQNEEALLPTILSRTQMLRVTRLKDEDVRQALMNAYGLSMGDANRISMLAEGNYNTAQKLHEAVENNHSDEFINWMRLCFIQNVPALIKWVDNMAKTGRENQKSFLLYSISLTRECLLMNKQLGALNRVLDAEKDFVEKFSPYIHEGNIYELIKQFNESHYYIERNANPKILFFNLSLLINELLKKRGI